jgi:hypothetical protein
MLRLLSLAAVVALTGVAAADDKKDEKKDAPALSGKWIREADGFSLVFGFEKEKMTIDVTAGDNGLVVTCSYKVDKDGKVTAEVTDVKEKGNFPTKPEKGSKLSFKIKVGEKSATVSDFDAHDSEGAKAIVEGEYKKKAD